MLKGLVLRNQKDLAGADAAHLNELSGGILHLLWKDIEPAQGQFTLTPNPYGDLPYKIRLLGGKDSPNWVKNRVGSFTYHEPQSGRTGIVPNVWTTEYIDLYTQAATALQYAYGDDANLVEVEFGLGLYYQEQYIRGTSDQRNVDSLNTLGITQQTDATAMIRLARQIRNVWPNHTIGTSFFPHQYLQDSMRKQDIDSTISIMTVAFDEGLWDVCGPHDGRSPLGAFREDYWEAVKGEDFGPWYVQLAQPNTPDRDFVGDPIFAAEDAIIRWQAECVELSHDWDTWAIADLQFLNSLFPKEVIPEPQRFDDVPPEHLFYNDIQWIAAAGITRGCNPPDNNLYCPDQVVTRGQMAAFLRRALEE